MTPVKHWLREPAWRFVLIGVGLFSLHVVLQRLGITEGRRITISEAMVQEIRRQHVRNTGALPDAREEAALIDQRINDEVLFREARAIGLDRDDEIIRRQLIQKMRFALEDLTPITPSTDAELRAWLDAHPDRYRVPRRVWLRQIFLSRDRRRDRLLVDAEQMYRSLNREGAKQASRLGDPFMLGYELASATEKDLQSMFGAEFARQAFTARRGRWSKPAPSAYGLHLIWIDRRDGGRLPDLADVRARVAKDLAEHRRQEANRAVLRQLRERYRVRVERPSLVAAQAGAVP